MPAHDSHDRPRKGARFQQSDDDELTLVGIERAKDLSQQPVVYVEPRPQCVGDDDRDG